MNAEQEVQAILILGAAGMLAEAARPLPSVKPPVSVDDTEDSSALAAGVAARYGETEVRPSSGNSGRWKTFLGDRIVIRVVQHERANGYDDPLERMTTLSTLPGGPAILELDREHGFMVERRHPGTRLDRVWQSSSRGAREQLIRDLRDFRDRLARHAITAADYARARDSLRDEVVTVLGEDLAPWAFAKIDGPLGWRHCDLHAENILVDPETGALSAVVDWEWARVTVEACDQSRLSAVTAYQIGADAAAAIGGVIEPEVLLVAYSLHTIPQGYLPGGNDFYDRILELLGRLARRS